MSFLLVGCLLAGRFRWPFQSWWCDKESTKSIQVLVWLSVFHTSLAQDFQAISHTLKALANCKNCPHHPSCECNYTERARNPPIFDPTSFSHPKGQLSKAAFWSFIVDYGIILKHKALICKHWRFRRTVNKFLPRAIPYFSNASVKRGAGAMLPF